VRLSSFVPRLAVNLTKHISDTNADPNDQKQASHLKIHFTLLTDAIATSQQLRITRNNFRLFACDQCCMRLLTVLSTACSAAASPGGARVVGAEKKKKKWALK
jgi:hypothetical protein